MCNDLYGTLIDVLITFIVLRFLVSICIVRATFLCAINFVIYFNLKNIFTKKDFKKLNWCLNLRREHQVMLFEKIPRQVQASLRKKKSSKENCNAR